MKSPLATTLGPVGAGGDDTDGDGSATAGAASSTVSSTHSFHGWNSASPTTPPRTTSAPTVIQVTGRRIHVRNRDMPPVNAITGA
jgi:hypothetical protein